MHSIATPALNARNVRLYNLCCRQGASSNASEGGYSVSDAGDMGTVQEQEREQPSEFDSGVVTPPPQDLHLDDHDQDGIAAGGEAATVVGTGTFSGADLPRIGWGEFGLHAQAPS
jgi:hypothetical protein